MIVSRSIIFLIIIWSVYLVNANYNSSYFFFISLNSSILIICFILSLFIGSVVFNLNSYNNKHELYSGGYEYLFIRDKIFNFCLTVYILVLIFILLRKILYPYIFNIELLRFELFSPTKQEPRLFAMIYVFVMYFKSIIFSFLSFFFFKSLFEKKYIKIFLIVLLLILESFIFNSKGILSSAIFLIVLYISLLKLKFIKEDVQFFIIMFQFLIIIILLIFIIEIKRSDGNPLYFVKEYLLISPALLSGIVDQTFQVFFNKWSFDNIFIIFSGLSYLITTLIRALGIQIVTDGYEIIKFLDMPQVVSSINYNFSLRNTFYTILLEPYLSLGYYGVIIVGFLFGFVISKNEYIFAKYNCDYSIFCLQFFCGVVAFGIFGSAFSTVSFWLVLGCIMFLKSLIFIKKKPTRE